MEIGVLAMLRENEDPLKMVHEHGFKTAQLQCWDMSLYTGKNIEMVKQSCKDNDIHLAAFWAGFTGRCVWNPVQGPGTLGLVPADLRKQRIADLKKGADFAAAIGAPALITHCGFIPESPSYPDYIPVLNAIHEVASYCQTLGIGFWFETGQETPLTLLRTIEDLNLPNLGINLDTANLILYGRGNPVDALEVFGKYVRNLHVKDGLFPVSGNLLGQEVPLGQGRADFDKIIPKLYELGFSGQLIIEREISGPRQIADINMARTFLEEKLARYSVKQ